MWSLSSVPPKALVNSSDYDELYTPREAIEPLLPYLHGWNHFPVWECAYGNGQLVGLLQDEGFKVVYQEDHNFFKDDPVDATWMLTNPPYSMKSAWLKRANESGMPWAFLLPVTTLGTRACQVELDHSDVNILFMPRRIDFTGKKAPWFSVAWFTRGLLSGEDQLIFT
jgi:hypothetical protein